MLRLRSGCVVGLECSERWEWLEFIAGGGEGYVAPPELSGSRRATTSGVSEGWRGSTFTWELCSVRTSTGGGGGRRQRHGAHYGFGRVVSMPAAASSASASARERSRAKRRKWWCGAAVVGELWIDHAMNKRSGAAQSVSGALPEACPHVVTTPAWSR